ncbi:MAG TPA: response regulator transcription factor [Saprospiraceae bacterium]|nr:response regulator transcription factor [Saprospiraceae bacterium]HMQ84581.1 response regulator transcription factor [Saprospiraceae bacterium]
MQIVKTIIADSHQIFLEGLKTVLVRQTDPKFEIVAQHTSGKALVKDLKQLHADLLILDLNLDEVDGLEVLKIVQKPPANLKVLVISNYDVPKIVRTAFKYGAGGFLPKNSNINLFFESVKELLDNNIVMGEGIGVTSPKGKQIAPAHNISVSLNDRFVKRYSLTKREVEILQLISQAMNNKQIAEKLFISDQTVSVHRKNIMRKLGVSNAAGLIKTAYENSLI